MDIVVVYRILKLFFLQFEDFSRELCVKSLLEIMDMFCHRLR